MKCVDSLIQIILSDMCSTGLYTNLAINCMHIYMCVCGKDLINCSVIWMLLSRVLFTLCFSSPSFCREKGCPDVVCDLLDIIRSCLHWPMLKHVTTSWWRQYDFSLYQKPFKWHLSWKGFCAWEWNVMPWNTKSVSGM